MRRKNKLVSHLNDKDLISNSVRFIQTKTVIIIESYVTWFLKHKILFTHTLIEFYQQTHYIRIKEAYTPKIREIDCFFIFLH